MIDPFNAIPMVRDSASIFRPGPGAESGAVGAPGLLPDRQQRLRAQLLETMQSERQASELFSTLPGPNVNFFQPPAPPQLAATQGPLMNGRPGPGLLSPTGSRERLNVPLLETMQQGRVASAMFSSLMGPREAGFLPSPGLEPPWGGALPRAGTRLLETEQQGRETSTLLSGILHPGWAEGSSRSSLFMTPPAEVNRRIAGEAYLRETRRDFERPGAGMLELFA